MLDRRHGLLVHSVSEYSPIGSLMSSLGRASGTVDS
jgi:hypothetical protein